MQPDNVLQNAAPASHPIPASSDVPSLVSGTPLQRLPAINHNEALQYLRLALQDSTATFKSSQQLELLSRSVARDSNILAILPTGGGKSICYEAPAVVFPKRLSIVFIPFVPLIQDQMRRATERNVKVAKWTSSQPVPPDVQILFVSWENIGTDKFMKSV